MQTTLHADDSETPRFRAIALVAFAAGKSSDYASHWLRRKLTGAGDASKPFALCLNEANLYHGRGDHRVHILDRRTALRLVALFPPEWPWPCRLASERFDATQDERGAAMLDAFAALHPAPDASALRRVGAAVEKQETKTPAPAVRGMVYAAFSAGNGLKVAASGERTVYKALKHTRRAVLNPYKVLAGLPCDDRGRTKRVLASLLCAPQVGPARAELYDAPEERALAAVRALWVMRRCLRRQSRRPPREYIKAPPVPVSRD